MHFSVLTSVILIGSLIFPAFASANTSNSTSIGISIVVPERLENQRCNIGFKTTNDSHYKPLQATGCKYNSNSLMQSASQLAEQQDTSLNSQGFVTVVITAP